MGRLAPAVASIVTLWLFAPAGGCGGSTASNGDAGSAGASDGASDARACRPIKCGTGCPNNAMFIDADGCRTCRCAPSADGGGTGATCSKSADCGAGFMCGFPEALACSATGTCYPDPGVDCQAYSPGCACDGTIVNIACTGLPGGYAPAPLLHEGECTEDAGAGADAGNGPSDSGAPCTKDSNCGGGICGFSTAAACAATGSCFPAPGATCLAYSPGCACDGTIVNVVCNGLPPGYAPAPLRHTGECADGG